MRPLLALALLIGSCCYVAADRAHAQNKVQRCMTLGGEAIYTDKRCEDVGGMDRLPRVNPATMGRSSLHRSGCSRTLSDLVYEITAAIENNDVNRLASVYHWAGVSNVAANNILDRLEAIVQRPLVDIVPVRPQPPVVNEEGTVIDENEDGYYPQTAARPRPVGLRLEQTLKNNGTPSRTYLRLQRSYNCFWVSL